jgi:hypothetical protein
MPQHAVGPGRQEVCRCTLFSGDKLGRLIRTHPWHNWIAHRSSEPRVAGSNPAGCTDRKDRDLPAPTQLSVTTKSVCGPVQNQSLYRKTRLRLQRGTPSMARPKAKAPARRYHISGQFCLYHCGSCKRTDDQEIRISVAQRTQPVAKVGIQIHRDTQISRP